MPSGRTHDRITLWSLPFVAGLTFGLTKSSDLTLIVAGSFLFSGLMFGPDLDIHSRQFIRWGWLRWIWIPYQKTLRHRSIFSHGPVIGTTLRVVYLANWLLLLGLLGLIVAQLWWGDEWSWQRLAEDAVGSLFQHYPQLIALLAGLELGAMSHSFSDWGGSAYKRFKKGGLKAVIPKLGKKKKRSHSTHATLTRKSTSSKSKSPRRATKKRIPKASPKNRTQRKK
ncbi:MAG: metal-binding protein [Aphanothece sp. CMT-3BRIN-NPC111]|nr:metal-binding protein [Aphanothece sp. CMT-3BRIN-NPC111]